MVKKVSKRSRAARRGEIPDDINNKSSTTTKSESINNNDGLKKSIIRTQIKNENLLNKKIESSKIKKNNKKKSSTIKTKLERNNKLAGILENKIDSSIARASYIQKARKSNWDKTNSNIEIKNHLSDDFKIEQPEKELTEEEILKLKEDELVRDFYKDEEINDENEEKDENDDDKPDLSNNKFALLEEVEA
ncbi:ECM1 [Candida pseudojiufengensis]|uniref:ECM1 n=1 Tax=Candida pseudojiufengensis TaxID=497109 RepID=UPI0022253A27|nr:ECM1 [Candida pseudojiufengensis]KAI5965800.1 ECM1 [Candida pseudojiufengensis]